jgi:hypothetical protein
MDDSEQITLPAALTLEFEELVVNGEFYGTFDSNINDQLQGAVDAGQEVTLEYTETQQGGKKFRNIVSVAVVGAVNDEAFEMVDDNEIPI